MSQPTISRTLSKAILKSEVRIKLKIWNTYLTGKLRQFDNYMNLIVDDAKEIYFGRGGKRSKNLGTVMIRGASIVFIGQDRKKIMFSDISDDDHDDGHDDDHDDDHDDEIIHDKLMHREEIEDV